MDVTVVGPVWDASGYAYHTRTHALWLRRLGVRVSLRPYPWGAARVELDEETRAALEEMRRTPEGRGPVLYITVANAFQKDPRRPSIGYTMLETDRIPPLWVELCRRMDAVLVPTEFTRRVFAGSGVEGERLHVVPLGCDPDAFRPGLAPLPLPGRRGFNFLANFEWIPRKGYDLLLAAYFQEFRADEDVCLILKTYDNSAYDPEGRRIREEILRRAEESGNPQPPAVLLLPRVLPPEALPRLYAAADCYVLPSRGEAWNHTALEAAACGLPLILTGWSAHLDLFDAQSCYFIPVTGLEPVPAFGVPNDQVYGGSRWAVPDLAETRRLMRHVFTHREEARARGRLARRVAQRHTWEESARRLLAVLARWAA